MNKTVKKLTLSAMFLAIGLVLPFLTMQIPQFGRMMLPMHIPVILCGLICGWKFGLPVGAILPLMRSALFTTPPMFPMAISMAFELAAYGFIVGILYERSRWHCIIALYRSMIVAMLAGRVVWGFAMFALLGGFGGNFTWQWFMAGAFIEAFPGIIVQLVLIPAIMVALRRAGLVQFHRERKGKSTVDN